TSEWIQFFKDAGIPVGPAANYAVTFTDNRIQKSMLMDLSREILHEMGIAVVGDVIAILKHAKVAHQQEIGKVAGIQTKSSGVLSTSSSLKRGQISPASRMIANSLSRDSPPNTPTRAASPEAPKLSFTVANRLGARPKPGTSVSEAQPEEVPVKRRRRVTAEMEGKYVVNMPKGITSRTKKILEQQTAKKKPLVRNSVFDRLGAESKPDTTTGTKPTGVFSRLGKVVAEDDKASSGGSSESQDNDEDTGSVLQYAGVLKRARLGLGKAAPRPTSSAFLLRASKPPVVTAIKRLAVTRSGGGSGSSVSKSKV
uniref:Chromosome 19 open reading frame 47 n=1 Tax=Petromyzon marinus TaxID=7757 RepID=S4RAD0_PETMA